MSAISAMPAGSGTRAHTPFTAVAHRPPPLAGALPASALHDALVAMLDAIDYGALVLDAQARVQFSNRAAQHALRQPAGPLLQPQQQLLTRNPARQAELVDACHDAALRHLRTLLLLDPRAPDASVAVLPGPTGMALMLLARSGLCEPLSSQGYAQRHGLTLAESAVLSALSEGQEPAQIARRHGVALSTVRSQIQAIRQKTGTRRIQDLVSRVAMLPPLRGALQLV